MFKEEAMNIKVGDVSTVSKCPSTIDSHIATI